uniref:HYR domain-containing protein n=1 Tax=Algoriphagus sp. TaxID=1872435 RepID=UPI002585C7C5
KPVITNMPVNIEVSTGEGICGAVVTWTEPSADDNCEIESFTADHTSGDLFPVGETTVTYTATDIHGIVETASFTVTVSDLEKPVITNMPVNIEVSTGEGICGAVVTWTEPSADDNCEIESFIADYSSGDLFQIGETTVTYTAKDIHGNTETASFTVIVTDLEKPLITNMPTNIEVNTDLGVCGAVVTWTEPNAADNCEIESFSADYSSGDLFQIGETTVTYTAKDIHGNTETASFTVTVTDLEKPVITNMPTIIEVNTDPGVCEAVVTWTEPNAADNCGIESFTADYTSGSEFPVGETTVTYTATDIHGNTETAIFTVKVIDGEKPQLAYPSDISSTVEFGSTGKIITYDLPIATDNCGTPSLELIDGLASGEIFPVGQTTVIYRATDVTGNTADCSFTVTITESDDNEDPIISDCPEDFAVNTDPGICGAVVTWIEPTSTDNSGSVTLVSNFEPGSIFPVGTSQVVYIATDDAGNQSTCTFNVTVNDIQAPTVITRNRTFTINPINEVNLLPSDIDNGTSDNCGVQSLELSKNLFTALDEGENTITLSAIDVNGNMAIEQAKVTILINAVDPGELDGDGDGYTPNQGDCDDSDDTVYPGAPELCDGKDNNCDGTIDEGVQTAYYLDADGDGFGDVNAEPLFGCSVPDGYVTENTDCDDSDDTVYPGALELCDGKDNNCDGTIDEGVQTAYYIDSDGDSFGDANGDPIFACSAPEGYVGNNLDCDDSDPSINPDVPGACASDPCGETIEIGSISGPLDPVQVNNPITVFAQISGEVMSAKWIWDNGDETVLSKPFGDFATQYTYSTPGVYQIRLVLADACGNETLGLTDLAVIFDPNGGFITGGGWIWSPKGAYQVDQEAEGRANFGFVAKYRKGSNKVDGNTEFQFRNGNLNFNSTSHEEMSLVIAGHRGIYKGKGTINREEGYSFMVSAIDGNLQDPVESDKFRIKIWETASGSIVYDNQLGTSDNAVATSAISGGNIVIHQPQKGKNKSIDPSGLVQVAWNTPIEELKDYTVLYELEEEAIGVMVDWKEEGYNPLVPGIYEITGKVKQLSSNRVIPMNSFSMYVLVMDKTMPLDISLSNQKISKDLKSGQVVGILQTEDPADNIHTYTLAPSADFELDGNQVVWIGDGELRNEYTISVTSIDRVGQSISKDIPITREIDTNQVTIYPNPASKETHVKVDLVQSNEVSIRVYDSAGRLMFEESGYRERGFILNVDLQTWSAGLYQIQVQIGFETITKRLVKIE